MSKRVYMAYYCAVTSVLIWGGIEDSSETTPRYDLALRAFKNAEDELGGQDIDIGRLLGLPSRHLVTVQFQMLKIRIRMKFPFS